MELPRNRSVIILAIFFSMFLSCCSQGLKNNSSDSLDDLLRHYAFEELHRPHGGVIHKVPLPANLSGIEASVIRLKSGSFWIRGSNFSAFDIPPGLIAIPFVRRLAIVYQNLGNWSNFYYNVPGYSLITPVVGFMAYDATNMSSGNITKLDFNVKENPITVSFSGVSQPEGLISMVKCARFGSGGTVYLSEMTLPYVCSTLNQGHFSLVIPPIIPALEPLPGPALPPAGAPKKNRKWKVWVIAFGCGVVGLVFVGLIVLAIVRFVMKKKMKKMESQADQGEALGNVWVSGSRMPSATAIRTQPVLENENAP